MSCRNIRGTQSNKQAFETVKMIQAVLVWITKSQVKRHDLIAVLVKVFAFPTTGVFFQKFGQQFVAIKNKAPYPAINLFIFIKKILKHLFDKIGLHAPELQHHPFGFVVLAVPQSTGLGVVEAAVVHRRRVAGFQIPVFLKDFLRLVNVEMLLFGFRAQVRFELI